MGTFCTDSCPLPLIKMTCLLGLSFSKSCSPQTRAFTWPFAWQSQLANWRCNEPGLLRGPIPLRIREVYSRVIAAPHLGHCCSKQGVPDWCVALTPQLGHTQSPPGPAAKRPPRPAPRFFPMPLPVPGPCPLGPVPSFLGIRITSFFLPIFPNPHCLCLLSFHSQDSCRSYKGHGSFENGLCRYPENAIRLTENTSFVISNHILMW